MRRWRAWIVPVLGLTLYLLVAASPVALSGILGALFPFASRLLGRLERQAGAEVGRVYAWNTAGAILGSLAEWLRGNGGG